MADLISSLPNEIICYILSFLPSQQVVATSVLSKRWNLLWRSVPSFDFDNINELFWHSFEEKTFYRSVDYFLLLHGDQPLHKFRLRFIIQPLYIFPLKSEIIYYYLTERLNIWIKDAVSGSSKLQHLDLYLNSNNVLPSVVFSCKTLVVLKLAYTTVKDIFVVDLPLLKILHLNYVYSSKKDDFCQLLSGIPNLEVLEVRDTRLINEGKFKECPKLVRADIDGGLVSLEIVKNVEVLFLRVICRQELVIDFQNLVELQLKYTFFPINWVEVLELLKHCPKLQTLDIKFSLDCPHKHCENELWSYPESVPECISSHLKTCHLLDFRFISGFQFVRYILGNAKYLQAMKIKIHTCKYDDNSDWEKLKRKIDVLSWMRKRSNTCILSFE